LVPVKAWQAVALFAFIEFFAGMEGGGAGLARFAHLGGMATGYIYLRFEDFFRLHTAAPLRRVKDGFQRVFARAMRRKSPVELHEVTDDMVKEVDRILEKVLKEGTESLTDHERQIMERYSKLKH